MAVEPLSALPAGVPVFLDANIFFLGLSKRSFSCNLLLERCLSEQQMGITTFSAVNEATHKFMVSEAYSLGRIPKPTANALRTKPSAIFGLTEYWRMTDAILKMDMLFLEANEAVLRQAQVERESYGLMTNDSIIVATMRLHGVHLIASHDSDFDGVSGITLFQPEDV